jgi:uncharacterized membrane protein
LAEPRGATGETDRGLGRLAAFSDGVYAIAITLLVLDVKVPQVEHGLGAALAAQWPSYLGYVVSFVIIGIWWANHHRLLDGFARSDHALLQLNTLHLMCIAFLPFATALLADYLRHGGEESTAATAVYAGTLLFSALLFAATWLYGARAGLLRAELTPAAVSWVSRQFGVSLLCYAVALGLAFLLPSASLAICVAVALYYALPRRRAA